MFSFSCLFCITVGVILKQVDNKCPNKNIRARNSKTLEPSSGLEQDEQMITTRGYEGGFWIVLRTEDETGQKCTDVRCKLECHQFAFYTWCFAFANDDVFNSLQKQLADHHHLSLVGRNYPPVIQWRKGFHSTEDDVCYALTGQLRAHTTNVRCFYFEESFIDVEKFKRLLSKPQDIVNKQAVVYNDTKSYFITGYEPNVNELSKIVFSLENAANPDGSISIVDVKQKPCASKNIDDKTQTASDNIHMTIKREETPKHFPGQTMALAAGNVKTTLSQSHSDLKTHSQATSLANTETGNLRSTSCDILGVTSSMAYDGNERQVASHFGNRGTEKGLEKPCVKTLTPLQTELYHRFCLHDKLFEGISVSLQGCNLHLQGNPQSVTDFINRITSNLDSLEKTKQIINRTLLPQELLDMMQFPDVLSHVSDNLRKVGLICYLEIISTSDDGICVEVYTRAEQSVVVKSLQSCFYLCEIDIDETWKLFLQDETIKAEMNHLENRYSSKLKFSQTDTKLHILCTSDFQEKAVHEKESLRKRKTEYCKEVKKKVESTPLKAGLCDTLLQNEVERIEKKFHVKFTSVSRGGKTGWIIKGPNGTLEQACMYFNQNILENLIEIQVQVSKSDRELFDTDEGQNILKQIAGEHKCRVVKETPATVSSESLDEPGQELWPCMNGRRWTFENKKVAGLYCGNINQSECEVHVFAKPKSNITTGTGTKQKDNYQCYKKGSKTFVVDILVAPQIEICQQLPVFEHVFSELCRNNFSSVAISLDDCENIQWPDRRFMLTALLQFKACKGSLGTCLFFYRHEDGYETVKKFISDYIRVFSIIVTKTEDNEILDQQGVQTGNKTKENVEVILIKGDLHTVAETENCDVVVNTTNEKLKLNEGAVSYSILTVAGPEIQKECKEKYPSGVKFGHFAVTKGYNLNCRYIFHGVFPHHVQDKEHKMLKDLMRKCLLEVDTLQLTSIAFPAIGTGNLKYPRHQVAAEMYEVVKKYISSDDHMKTIQRIYFVVYGLDTETYKVFEREQAKFEMSFQDMPPSSGPVARSRPMDGLYMRYGNTDLHVTQRNVAKCQADCLVIFWTTLDINTNPLKKTYFLKAGETVVTEWRNGIPKLRKEKVNYTQAGDLHYRQILHLMTSDSSLSEDVQTLFKVVKQDSWTSIVIPFQKSMDEITKLRDKFAVAIDTCLKVYDKEKTCRLESIEIAIDKDGLYKAFKEKMAKQDKDAVIGDFDDKGAVGGAGAVEGVLGGAARGAFGGAGAVEGVLGGAAKGEFGGAGGTVEGALGGAARGSFGGAGGAVEGALGGAAKGEFGGADQNSPHEIDLQLVSVCHNKDISEPRLTIVGFNRDVEQAVQKLNENIVNLSKKKTMASHPLKLTEGDKAKSNSQSKVTASHDNEDVMKVTQERVEEKRETEQIRVEEKDIAKNVDKKDKGFEGTLKEQQQEEIMRTQRDKNLKVTETQDSENAEIENIKKQEKNEKKKVTYERKANTEDRCSDTETEKAVICEKEATDTKNAAPGTRAPISQKEYEKRRLIFKPKDERNILKKTAVEQVLEHWRRDWSTYVDIVYPFGNNEALLIWKSSDDASSFVQLFKSPRYQLGNFPAQAVVNVKATINFEVIQKAQQQNCMDELQKVYEYSGAHLVTSGDKAWLEGSLLEIQLGCKYFAEVVESKSLLKREQIESHEPKGDRKALLNINAQKLNPNSLSLESSGEGKVMYSKMEYCEVRFFEPDCFDNISEVWNENKTKVELSGDLAPLMQAKSRVDGYETLEIDNCTDDGIRKFKSMMQDFEKDKVWCYTDFDPPTKMIMRCKDHRTLENAKAKFLHALNRPKVAHHKDHKFVDVPSASLGATGQQESMPVARKETDSHSNSLKSPKGSEVTTLKHDISVRVHVGDILKLDVECIVNAATANLRLDYGISKVIAEAAGPKLQEACSNFMKNRGLMKIGESVATEAGNLPFKCIIHTMGPYWYGNCSELPFKYNIAKAIETCLKLADKKGMTSVGIPAISAGATGVSFELCAEGYALGIENFVKAVTATTLKEIHFVLLDGGAAFIVRQIFNKEHDTAALMPSLHTSVREGTLYTLKHNMSLFVCTGDMLDMDCEMIVNFENKEFQSVLPLTKQLHKKAGKDYTDEYARKQPATEGAEITSFETGGGLLPGVKTILHFILPKYSLQKNSEEALPYVLECYQHTLRRADALNVVTVALPFFCVDTFTTKEVRNMAVCLVGHVMEFSQTRKPDSELRRIHIVSEKGNIELIKRKVEATFGNYAIYGKESSV